MGSGISGSLDQLTRAIIGISTTRKAIMKQYIDDYLKQENIEVSKELSDKDLLDLLLELINHSAGHDNYNNEIFNLLYQVENIGQSTPEEFQLAELFMIAGPIFVKNQHQNNVEELPLIDKEKLNIIGQLFDSYSGFNKYIEIDATPLYFKHVILKSSLDEVDQLINQYTYADINREEKINGLNIMLRSLNQLKSEAASYHIFKDDNLISIKQTDSGSIDVNLIKYDDVEKSLKNCLKIVSRKLKIRGRKDDLKLYLLNATKNIIDINNIENFISSNFIKEGEFSHQDYSEFEVLPLDSYSGINLVRLFRLLADQEKITSSKSEICEWIHITFRGLNGLTMGNIRDYLRRSKYEVVKGTSNHVINQYIHHFSYIYKQEKLKSNKQTGS